MTTQTYSSGKVIGYGYDDKGELVSISILNSDFTNYNIEEQGNIVMDYFLLEKGVTLNHNYWWGSQTQPGIDYQTPSYGALYFTVTNAGIQ